MGCRSMKAWRTSSSDLPRALACAAMRSSSEGDWIVPGQMALQRTPWRMKSAATDLVRPTTAAFDVP